MSQLSSLQVPTTTPPPLPNGVFIRVDALEAALAKLKVTGITATQLLHAVYEEESNLAPTPSRPEQTVAVPTRTCLHLYAINRGHSDGIV